MLNRSTISPKSTTTDLVSRFMSAWSARARAKRGGAIFTLDGAPLSDNDVGSPVALLPVLIWHADNLFKFGFRGTDMGVVFVEDDEALLRRSVSLDRLKRSNAELLNFLLEAAEDARQHLPACEILKGAVDLRGLVSQFTQAMGVSLDPERDDVAGNRFSA